MAGRPQTLTEGQKKEVTRLIWKRILGSSLVLLALFSGITGLSVWGMYVRLNNYLEELVAKQFEEPRIQEVVDNVAGTKAEALLIKQINPEVEKFKTEVNQQIEGIRSIVAKIEALKSQSDSNVKQIDKVLSSVRSSEQTIEKFKETLLGLQSDFVKINRGLVEIQYFAFKGRNHIPNPYTELMVKKLNEILTIAIPNRQERAKFVKELEAYKLEE